MILLPKSCECVKIESKGSHQETEEIDTSKDGENGIVSG